MMNFLFQKKASTMDGHTPSYIKRFFAFVIDWYLGSMLSRSLSPSHTIASSQINPRYWICVICPFPSLASPYWHP